MSFIAVGVGLAGAGVSYFSNRKKKKEAEREQAKMKAQMEKQRAAFESAEISNPFAGMTNQFAGMENTMEDLTVNQQQAQFEAQQGAQQRANIMDQMSGAAGGSGVAALAQQMAQSGQLASQQASASIGQQEAANQAKMAAEAGRLQTQEAKGAQDVAQQIAQGESTCQQREMDRQSTLLGMDQQAYAGAQERTAGYEAAQMDALSSGISSLSGLSDRKAKENIELIGSSPSGINIYTFEYKDKRFGEGKFQGAMSDEVPRDVVTKHESGYEMIDYSKIDVEFKSIK